MATRSALASLPARLRPISAATAAGGWRRLLSDDPTKGSTEDTKELARDEDKRLEDPNMREELPMVTSSAHPVHTQAQSENISIKDQLEQSRKEMNQLKDQLEKAELENQLLKNQIHKFSQAENENSFKVHLEESRKETNQLKNQLEKAEAEKHLLKDQIYKALETVISKQTVNFESKLANDRMHIDESTREMQHRSKEFKRNVKLDVFRLKEKCSRRSEMGEEATTILEGKNTKFQNDLIVKVQRAQYNVVKTTALAAVAIGGTIFLVIHLFKKKGE